MPNWLREQNEVTGSRFINPINTHSNTTRRKKTSCSKPLWDDDPDFQQWIRYPFDRDAPTGEWNFEELLMPLTEAQTVHFIHRLCATAVTELTWYSELQIAYGLHFVFDGNFLYGYALRDGEVDLKAKLKAIAAMATLFRNCLNERCTRVSKLDEVCFHFWDETPLTWCKRNPDKEAIYHAIADVMRQCLNLKNVSCVESALHGLGHLRMVHPEAADIVRHFLNTTQRIDPNLLRYAEAAEEGKVQ